LKRFDNSTDLFKTNHTAPSRPASLAVPASLGVHKPAPSIAVEQPNPIERKAPINSPQPTPNSEDVTCAPDDTQKRVSTRNRKPRDFLTPKMKGKA
jgi:hypothetical protein